MAIRFNAWMLALMSCLLVSPAMANEEGAYIAINVGQSKDKGACVSPWVANGTACKETSAAYRLTYGYQYTPAWGLELSYGDLAKASSNGIYAVGAPQFGTSGAVGPASYAWSLKAMGWSIAAVGTLHLGDVFSVFGKVGGVRADFKEDNFVIDAANKTYSYSNSIAMNRLTYGVGYQFDFTPKLALRMQYENFGTYTLYSSKIKLSMFSGGLVFKY